jgi:hypothetical protein
MRSIQLLILDHDHGPPYKIDVPFMLPDHLSDLTPTHWDNLEWFRAEQATTYSEFSDNKVVAIYDFEMNDDIDALDKADDAVEFAKEHKKLMQPEVITSEVRDEWKNRKAKDIKKG